MWFPMRRQQQQHIEISSELLQLPACIFPTAISKLPCHTHHTLQQPPPGWNPRALSSRGLGRWIVVKPVNSPKTEVRTLAAPYIFDVRLPSGRVLVVATSCHFTQCLTMSALQDMQAHGPEDRADRTFITISPRAPRRPRSFIAIDCSTYQCNTTA